MNTETEINSSDRYLLCNYYISDKVIDRVKDDVKAFMADKEKDDKYSEFINWQKNNNEIVVLTMYAYDDILLPKKYDTVFQIDKPTNFVHLDFTITQAVLNGWTAVNKISRGHKHICVIQFKKTVNYIFSLLTLFDPKQPANNNIQLGFCDQSNFEEIKKRLGKNLSDS
jgi:hypothetical protein